MTQGVIMVTDVSQDDAQQIGRSMSSIHQIEIARDGLAVVLVIRAFGPFTAADFNGLPVTLDVARPDGDQQVTGCLLALPTDAMPGTRHRFPVRLDQPNQAELIQISGRASFSNVRRFTLRHPASKDYVQTNVFFRPSA